MLSVTAQVASLQLRLDDVTARLAAAAADRDTLAARVEEGARERRALLQQLSTLETAATAWRVDARVGTIAVAMEGVATIADKIGTGALKPPPGGRA